MTLRNVLLTLIALAVLALCADLALLAHRIAADVHQAAASVTGVATHVDTAVDRTSAGIVGAVDHVDKVITGLDASLGTTIGNVTSPLPVATSAASLASFFKPSTPAPTPAPKRP